jgi:hypothetical protein
MGDRWAGNIRELRNVIERAVILSTGGRARLDLAMPDDTEAQADVKVALAQPDGTDFVTDADMREREKANLIAALHHPEEGPHRRTAVPPGGVTGERGTHPAGSESCTAYLVFPRMVYCIRTECDTTTPPSAPGINSRIEPTRAGMSRHYWRRVSAG